MQCSKLHHYSITSVGANQNRWRDRKTERLGGLDVDGHREFYRQLDRQVRHLRAAQNAVDIAGGASKLIGVVRSIELVPLGCDLRYAAGNKGQPAGGDEPIVRRAEEP
jgi:hypothetical protein